MSRPDADDDTEVSTDAPLTTATRPRSRALQTPALEAVVVDGPADVEDFRDRYHQGQLIGRGGMGDVVEHMDRLVGRRVAVKVCAGCIRKTPRPRESPARSSMGASCRPRGTTRRCLPSSTRS